MPQKTTEDLYLETFEKRPVNHKALADLVSANLGARIRTWLDICSRCGLCAQSCFVYLSNHRDPRLSPAYKVKHTLGEFVRRKGRVDQAFLEKCYETAWLHCTLCKRCSLYCPFGIDIATMLSLVRTLCHSQGIVPSKLAFFTENCAKSGNHMDLPPEELAETCNWMSEEASETVAGVSMPMDKEDTEYLYTINPREPVFYPQDLADAAMIFTVAGENWTFGSRGWDATNLPMFAGDRKVAGKQADNIYQEAKRLKAKKILITECGHALRSLRYEGPYLAGYADGLPPVPVVHYVELLYEYLRDGRIKLDPAKKLKEPVTYQDPCNVSRNGGIWEVPRKIISLLCEDFRDMAENREYNHCCGGGGGILPMGPDYRPRRMLNGRLKAEQIRQTGAKVVIAPCHNCFDQVRDLSEHYELGVKVVSFKELVVHQMIVPENLQPAGE
ncbi:MAG: (Fe-S)-binding protein [Thermodesulfobacteriota bacterium]